MNGRLFYACFSVTLPGDRIWACLFEHRGGHQARLLNGPGWLPGMAETSYRTTDGISCTGSPRAKAGVVTDRISLQDPLGVNWWSYGAGRIRDPRWVRIFNRITLLVSVALVYGFSIRFRNNKWILTGRNKFDPGQGGNQLPVISGFCTGHSYPCDRV